MELCKLLFVSQVYLALYLRLMNEVAIALLTDTCFNHCLGGHTGDTYGAVVKWTEVLLLCVLVTLE
ncbi:hypothetical protein CYANOKiyG1_76240 [Okeania sp. KiyG1]|nr:hypothetical protein CYANOKiyG1_76240 [Okeania sp. KiyG1]